MAFKLQEEGVSLLTLLPLDLLLSSIQWACPCWGVSHSESSATEISPRQKLHRTGMCVCPLRRPQTWEGNGEFTSNPLEHSLLSLIISLLRLLLQSNDWEISSDYKKSIMHLNNLFVYSFKCFLSIFDFLRLCKETFKDKSHPGVLSPVSTPSGLMTEELPLPQRDGRLQAQDTGHHYSAREGQTRTSRPSRSAPM